MAPDTGNSKLTYKKLQKTINKDFVALSKSFNSFIISYFWAQFGYSLIITIQHFFNYIIFLYLKFPKFLFLNKFLIL